MPLTAPQKNDWGDLKHRTYYFSALHGTPPPEWPAQGFFLMEIQRDSDRLFNSIERCGRKRSQGRINRRYFLDGCHLITFRPGVLG